MSKFWKHITSAISLSQIDHFILFYLQNKYFTIDDLFIVAGEKQDSFFFKLFYRQFELCTTRNIILNM